MYYAPSDFSDEARAASSEVRWFYCAILVFTAVANVVMNVTFVSQMAFFAKMADPTMGGTYMTLLNTVANLGSKWPNTLVLALVDPLTVKACVERGTDGECVSETTTLDGYYILTGVSLVLGLVWLQLMRARVTGLQDAPKHAWRVPK